MNTSDTLAANSTEKAVSENKTLSVKDEKYMKLVKERKANLTEQLKFY